MKEDFLIGIALRSHHSRSDLTESDTMSPTFSMKYQCIPFMGAVYRRSVAHIFDFECRTLEMAFRKQPSDFQFLSHIERFL